MPDMEKTFAVINALEQEGIITNYALGGATALIFYTQPVNTIDVDVFIFLPPSKEEGLDLDPFHHVYRALEKKGYTQRVRECIIIEGLQVQFLPDTSRLVEEAIQEAEIKCYQEVPMKVFSIEHLIAIALETNRAKDRARIASLLEDTVEIDQKKLRAILARHNLLKRWEKLLEQQK